MACNLELNGEQSETNVNINHVFSHQPTATVKSTEGT